jgi:hypothetical protein
LIGVAYISINIAATEGIAIILKVYLVTCTLFIIIFSISCFLNIFISQECTEEDNEN